MNRRKDIIRRSKTKNGAIGKDFGSRRPRRNGLDEDSSRSEDVYRGERRGGTYNNEERALSKGGKRNPFSEKTCSFSQ